MAEILLTPLTKYPLITITWFIILFRIFKPMRASDGRPSNSLTGLFCVTLVIFLVTIGDTMNDRPNVSSNTTISSNKKGTKVKRRRRGGNAYSNAKVRSVNDKKYSILGTLWVGFMLLYLLSHKGERVWLWAVRFIMAIRGKHNPIEGIEPNALDQFVVEHVNYDPSDDNKEFALRMVLAKRGVVVRKESDPSTLVPSVGVDVSVTSEGSAESEAPREGAGGGIPAALLEE